MQTNRLSHASSRQGFALLITMAFLATVLIIFASIFYWVNTNATITQRNNQYNMSENAAESAVEFVMGKMDRDFIAGSISNVPSIYNTLPNSISQAGWPIQYGFSDTNGNQGVVSVVFSPQTTNVQPLNSQYSGLSGQYEQVDIYAVATPSNQLYNVPATVHESLQFANIPLYQFAIFYNVNMEIDPGSTMSVSGPVFCNQNIWEGSDVLSFASTVTAHGTNAPQVLDPFSDGYNGTGPSTFIPGQPLNNANQLTMPIGTNNDPGAVISMLELPPSAYWLNTSGAYSSNGMLYPANACDIFITNCPWGTNCGSASVKPFGTNFVAYYQDYGWTQIPYDYYIITNGSSGATYSTNYVAPGVVNGKTNIYYAGFSWLTNVAFYDWREGWNGGSGPAKRVEAVQINVTNLSLWLASSNYNGGSSYDALKVLHAGHHIGAVYVYNGVPMTTQTLPAVRVAKGAQLPNPGGSGYGFTVATEFPMYVLGDYNSQNAGASALGVYSTNGTTLATANTLPASLMADSVTILSDSWVDYLTSATTPKNPAGGATTVNAAMLEGIVQTNPNISGNYSGGVENFLRLLENWSGALTYNGSIVVLFYSQWATNSWQPTGNYYDPPTRHWAFDLNFQNANKLPPMTPDSRAMIRGNWYAHQ